MDAKAGSTARPEQQSLVPKLWSAIRTSLLSLPKVWENRRRRCSRMPFPEGFSESVPILGISEPATEAMARACGTRQIVRAGRRLLIKKKMRAGGVW